MLLNRVLRCGKVNGNRFKSDIAFENFEIDAEVNSFVFCDNYELIFASHGRELCAEFKCECCFVVVEHLNYLRRLQLSRLRRLFGCESLRSLIQRTVDLRRLRLSYKLNIFLT